jgi:sugar lactone lactonase YvrE
VAGKGFGTIDRIAKRIDYFSQPLPDDHSQHVRFNDGACDSRGRFFAGTICSREHNLPGKLYRYDPSTASTDIVDEGPFTVNRSKFQDGNSC